MNRVINGASSSSPVNLEEFSPLRRDYSRVSPVRGHVVAENGSRFFSTEPELHGGSKSGVSADGVGSFSSAGSGSSSVGGSGSFSARAPGADGFRASTSGDSGAVPLGGSKIGAPSESMGSMAPSNSENLPQSVSNWSSLFSTMIKLHFVAPLVKMDKNRLLSPNLC